MSYLQFQTYEEETTTTLFVGLECASSDCFISKNISKHNSASTRFYHVDVAKYTTFHPLMEPAGIRTHDLRYSSVVCNQAYMTTTAFFCRLNKMKLKGYNFTIKKDKHKIKEIWKKETLKVGRFYCFDIRETCQSFKFSRCQNHVFFTKKNPNKQIILQEAF